jgi:hypothetical protein
MAALKQRRSDHDESALLIVARAQGRQGLGIDRDLDAPRDARLSSNQSAALQGEHHLMDRRRRDAEAALHVGFGRRSTQHERVGMDEREILPLLVREAVRPRGGGWSGFCFNCSANIAN